MPAEPPDAVPGFSRAGLRRCLRSTPDAIRDALAEAQAWMTARGLSPILRAEAELVLAEVLNNIAEHAYQESRGQIVLYLRPRAEGLFCFITDHGAAMPGGGLPEGRRPDIGGARADLPEGGFGWHLIRLLTNNLRYDRKRGRNRLGFHLDGRTWR